MKPEGNLNVIWELHGYIDMDFTDNNDTWKSVTVYIVIINSIVISLHSQSHKTVTLSVPEAEY